MGECPCQSGQTFGNCCELYLAGEQSPATAEALMRSRYTAYVMNDEAYLRQSWHPVFRPVSVSAMPGQKWLGLKIRRVEAGGPEDDTGVVEFVARCKVDGKGHRLHESSRLVREGDRWLYTDGDLPD